MTKTVMVKWHNANKKHYESKGYIFTNYGDEFEVKVEDLSDGNNNVKIQVKCDNEDCDNILNIGWFDYLNSMKKYDSCHCKKCATVKRKQNEAKTRLKNGISFEKWCIQNNRQDVLNRWDYDLNNCNPDEILFGNTKKYFFKCGYNTNHKSELKNIKSFTSGQEGSIKCYQCNSFAQWGIDNICEDFLEKYWSKNNILNPWKLEYGSKIKVKIICQEVKYHEDYDISCNHFVSGKRCSYCSNQKVHPKDSIAQYIIDKSGKEFLNKVWSYEKNVKSPFNYKPFSMVKVWWKCPNDKNHEDYFREISVSNICEFRCPQCQFSKGEKRIEDYLKQNNLNYISQKEFDGLIGLKGGNLSYDFYLPQYNLLIEYQGEQHEKPIEYFGGKKQFKIQQEHDKRKKQYAEDNNIKLLSIWYYDYDNIETILNKILFRR